MLARQITSHLYVDLDQIEAVTIAREAMTLAGPRPHGGRRWIHLSMRSGKTHTVTVDHPDTGAPTLTAEDCDEHARQWVRDHLHPLQGVTAKLNSWRNPQP